jgi:protein SCO1/2
MRHAGNVVLRARVHAVATIVAALVAAALTVVGTGCGAGSSAGTTTPVNLDDVAGAPGVRGVTLATPVQTPETVLTDTAGHPFNLRAATAGTLTLVFFGYTHCPDICPTTMADLATALRQVTPPDREKVRVIFVATDPDRDTGPVVRRWLDQFDPSFIGLIGTSAEVNSLAGTLDVPVEAPERQPDGSWIVTHGSQVTAFSPDGTARVAYLTGTTVADYAHDIPLLLRGEH